MSCDAVGKSQRRIIRTCYVLSFRTKNENLKQQYFQLAQYAEELKPNFSAAGFYNINQNTLSSVFSITVTYLVIIIQFNMASSNQGSISTPSTEYTTKVNASI